MLDKIYENNLAFYEMVKITTFLCNNVSDEFNDDAKKIITFVGKAYGFDKALIAYCVEQITGELSIIQTDEDVRTYRSLKREEKPSEDIKNPLLKFKHDAVTEIASIDFARVPLNKVWFDYSFPNDYNAKIRYNELSNSTGPGLIDINKTVAVMDYLGIGTKKDLASASRRFKQCMLWGDMASIKFLALIYKEEKDEENEKIYNELFSLTSYINNGITVLPENIKEKINEKTNELFVLISSIKHDIIYRFNISLIDFSFAEIMMDERVDYYKKLRYINEYRHYDWTDETNSSVKEGPRMGFKIGG